MQMHLEIDFAIQNRAAFDQRAKDVQNPASPEYHHQITAAESHLRFGESHVQFQAVEAWLRAQGFAIIDERYGQVSDYIKFTGLSANVEKVFATRIVLLDDRTFANTIDPAIPREFYGLISYIQGLTNVGTIIGASAGSLGAANTAKSELPLAVLCSRVPEPLM